MNFLPKHTRIALGYFLVAALLGILLRLFFVIPISANFRYVVHAHSHIALLGWVYLCLITLIYKMYCNQNEAHGTYLKIFWFTNITLLGMLFTFPFTGYAFLSITFSTLFLIASYFFAWFILKRSREKYKNIFSFKCIQAAIWYMVISSIGPWALGGIMTTLGSTSIWYKLAIYFYLHFQYNAWFILALIGILFFVLENAGLAVNRREFRSFFVLINSGFILSFFLSALWLEPPEIVYILAAAGAILQVLGFWKLFLIIRTRWNQLVNALTPYVTLLFKIAGILLLLKITMQTVTAVKYFADLSFLYTDFVIGYLHLVFLGAVTIALFAFQLHFRLLKLPKIPFWIYFTGFVLSESLIFYKATSIWLRLQFFPDYFLLLVSVSSLMPLALIFILIKNISYKLTKD